MEYTIADYKGYESYNFEINGRKSIVIAPKEAADGKPWVWRTEFLGAFDIVDMAMLERGWHVCYHKCSDMYGCPQAIAWMREFQKVAEEEFGLSPYPALFGFSRGGLYAVNYAKTYPYKVGLLYLDAPVLDIRNWPITTGTDKVREECLAWYHLTLETLDDFKECPIDFAKDIADSNIPVLIISGAADKTVDYKQNTCVFEERYRAAGGKRMTIAVKPHCDHHPHSLYDEPDFAVAYIEANVRRA